MNSNDSVRSAEHLVCLPDSLKPLAQYLMHKPEVWCDRPFGDQAWVFKLDDKMLALLYQRNGHDCVNLKCDPQQALELRDVFASVTAGYHMNKRHWNTVQLHGDVPQGELERLCDHSYALIFKALTKAKQRALLIRYSEAELLG